MSDEKGASRRELLLDAAIGGATACVGVLATYPAVHSLTPPTASRSDRGVVGRRTDFTPGTASTRAIGARLVVVVSTMDGTLRAFDARCTHLGCTVGFDSSTREIACACHGGRFALDGAVLAGPAPSALRALALELVGDEVVVVDP